MSITTIATDAEIFGHFNGFHPTTEDEIEGVRQCLTVFTENRGDGFVPSNR